MDQLLLDIDHVCSVSGEEDLSSLKKYILSERGWRCLTVLHLLGSQVRFKIKLCLFLFHVCMNHCKQLI